MRKQLIKFIMLHVWKVCGKWSKFYPANTISDFLLHSGVARQAFFDSPPPPASHIFFSRLRLSTPKHLMTASASASASRTFRLRLRLRLPPPNNLYVSLRLSPPITHLIGTKNPTFLHVRLLLHQLMFTSSIISFLHLQYKSSSIKFHNFPVINSPITYKWNWVNFKLNWL